MGGKRNHLRKKVPKLDMDKFYGSDIVGWLSHMEHCFTPHHIKNDKAKLHVGVFYLDFERWKLWKWYHKSYGGYLSWSIFAKCFITHFDQEFHFIGKLTKLYQTSDVDEFIVDFEQLTIHTEGLSDAFYTKCFINVLKVAIQEHVQMIQMIKPTSYI